MTPSGSRRSCAGQPAPAHGDYDTGLHSFIDPRRSTRTSRLPREGPAVNSGPRQPEVMQHGRSNVEGRHADVAATAGGEARTADEQERALLVRAQAAVLATAGIVERRFGIERDVAVAADSELVRAVVGWSVTATARAPSTGNPRAASSGPVRTRSTQSSPSRKRRRSSTVAFAAREREISAARAVGRHHDVARVGRRLETGLDEQPVDGDGAARRLHAVVGAHDEERLLAIAQRVQRPEHVLHAAVGAGDGLQVRGGAQRSAMAGVVRLRQPRARPAPGGASSTPHRRSGPSWRRPRRCPAR